MGIEPLIAWALAGCSETGPDLPRFDGPVAVAVLDPAWGGPFDQPVGFVAGSRDGRIVPIDLVTGWPLADDPYSPFLDAAPVPTGAARILADVAAWSPSPEEVTLYAADAAAGMLVEAPYVVGVEGEGWPVEVEPVLVGDPAFEDLDGSGDAATVEGVRLLAGATTTETWTLTFDGEAWTVEGSASGLQAWPARTGEPYVSDRGEVTFTITGSASAGDRITFATDTGVVEHDLGGTPQALLALPAAGVLLASVYDRVGGEGHLVVFDPALGSVVGEVPLDPGAEPWRMSTDAANSRVYVADAALALAWEVVLDPLDPSASAVRAIEMPGPLADLAWVADEDYDHLFVAPAGANRVDVYDLAADAWLDVNPLGPGVEGIALDSPVMGMAAAPEPAFLPHPTNDGGVRSARTVAIATLAGDLWLAEAATGCFVQDETGPIAYPASSFFQDAAPVSNPAMLLSSSSDSPIQLNACGGLTRSEDWTAVYDERLGRWRVEGTRSGPQEALAAEDERYVSDEGVLSFLILAGDQPSSEGDTFAWSTVSGLVRTNGDIDGDGQIDQALELPGRPAAYAYLDEAGTEDGWTVGYWRVKAAWPITNSDLVVKVDLGDANLDSIWD